MSALDHAFVFIMAGGSGERFWPLSRKTTPKQLLALFSDKTLLEETVQRVQTLVPKDRLFVLTNHAQVEPTLEKAPSLSAEQVIGEPAKRDTAPAASLATAIARAKDPEAVIVLLPADQLIQDTDAFQQNLSDAIEFASGSPALMTIAIKPTFPSTGFGYLKLGTDLSPEGCQSTLKEVEQFVEKPDLDTAKGYVDSGQYAWNAGMFAWKAESYLAVAKEHQPELATFISDFPRGEKDDFSGYLAEKFKQLPKISVDYAIMEKANQVVATEASFDWDDVGTWTALEGHIPANEQGNTVKLNSEEGSTSSLDASGNIVFSSGRTVALCGVKDLVVVEVDDAVLVCHKDSVQNIKKLLPNVPPSAL